MTRRGCTTLVRSAYEGGRSPRWNANKEKFHGRGDELSRARLSDVSEDRHASCSKLTILYHVINERWKFLSWPIPLNWHLSPYFSWIQITDYFVKSSFLRFSNIYIYIKRVYTIYIGSSFCVPCASYKFIGIVIRLRFIKYIRNVTRA